jgi:hypothetical protein
VHLTLDARCWEGFGAMAPVSIPFDLAMIETCIPKNTCTHFVAKERKGKRREGKGSALMTGRER